MSVETNLILISDHVKMDVHYTDNKTGLGENKILKPYGSLMNSWGKCASYDLKDYEKQLRYVEIHSPVEVDIIFHGKEHSNIPMELSTRLRFDGNHNVLITVDKTIDISQSDKPCYDPEKHEGEAYGDYDFKLLNKRFLDQFNCTSPFISPKFRKGGEICLNTTSGRMIHEILRQTSASFNPNMWKANYHSIPPCVYHTYKVQQTRSEGKFEKFNKN